VSSEWRSALLGIGRGARRSAAEHAAGALAAHCGSPPQRTAAWPAPPPVGSRLLTHPPARPPPLQPSLPPSLSPRSTRRPFSATAPPSRWPPPRSRRPSPAGALPPRAGRRTAAAAAGQARRPRRALCRCRGRGHTRSSPSPSPTQQPQRHLRRVEPGAARSARRRQRGPRPLRCAARLHPHARPLAAPACPRTPAEGDAARAAWPRRCLRGPLRPAAAQHHRCHHMRAHPHLPAAAAAGEDPLLLAERAAKDAQRAVDARPTWARAYSRLVRGLLQLWPGTARPPACRAGGGAAVAWHSAPACRAARPLRSVRAARLAAGPSSHPHPPPHPDTAPLPPAPPSARHPRPHTHPQTHPSPPHPRAWRSSCSSATPRRGRRIPRAWSWSRAAPPWLMAWPRWTKSWRRRQRRRQRRQRAPRGRRAPAARPRGSGWAAPLRFRPGSWGWFCWGRPGRCCPSALQEPSAPLLTPPPLPARRCCARRRCWTATRRTTLSAPCA
jgi:hypothetical protein